MAVIFIFQQKRPVVKIGRFAGQFAKPRTHEFETRMGETLPVYRGDLINGNEWSQISRTPDPERMLRGYAQSAATLNFLRALAQGGSAHIDDVHAWNVDCIKRSLPAQKYESMVAHLEMERIQERHSPLREVEFYTSHEALLLNYEQALTRREEYENKVSLSTEGDWYDCSAHLLWIGDRTRQLEGAHVEFLRGVKNPIGLKCGPTLLPDELIQLIDVLNPENEPGRLTLITRMGHEKIDQKLPVLIQRIQKEGRKVLWCCDPMHGNTITASNGYKTRDFHHILSEVQKFFFIHHAEGTLAGGVHCELTGNEVVECLGGEQAITTEHLSEGMYETLCDPRLNAHQAIEFALQVFDREYLECRIEKN